MLQVNVLSGKMAGTSHVIRHFPFVAGRGADANLRLEDPGVWEGHCSISITVDHSFLVKFLDSAPGLVNGETANEKNLRSGDVVDLGGARLQFWLCPPGLAKHTAREVFTWSLALVASGLQIALVYWLSR